MTEIVKVQMPLVTTEANAPAMIYARGQRHLVFTEVTEDLRAKMAGSQKRFFNATWTGKSWVLNDPAAMQFW